MPRFHFDFRENPTFKEYAKKYVAMVTIYSPRTVITKSKRVKAIGFNDQLSAIGGAFGLFTGISILSMVEVLCCIMKLIIKSSKKCICNH